ncbi:MAG: IclR family transcriptional regulator, partial [Acidimicrobiia bacterium]
KLFWPLVRIFHLVRQEPATESSYFVRAVLRVMDVFDVLTASPGGVSLAELAKVTELPKSSAFRYLTTLESRNYVEKDPETGSYRLGRALFPTRGRQLELLAARALPMMIRLRNRFGETVNLGVLDGDRISYIEILESPKSMRLAARRGDRHPIHSTALGKAIAAALPSTVVEAILASEGMPQLTPRTITDPELYIKELEQVRDRGFALDDRENEEDGRCIATGLHAIGLPAAISISAPASRLTMEDVGLVAEALAEAAWEISRDSRRDSA